jgi:Condensation domain
MPLTGPLFRFALFRTRPDEFYWFTCCHHIVIDGSGVALVGHRIAAIYSAIVSGASIPPAFFGSLQDLVSRELEYEASTEYLEDQTYWSGNLPSESGPDYRLLPDHRRPAALERRTGGRWFQTPRGAVDRPGGGLGSDRRPGPRQQPHVLRGRPCRSPRGHCPVITTDLGKATMSVRHEATNVNLRGVPNQGATSEPRFSSRSVADRSLDLKPGQLKHHEGRPLVREATRRSQADNASNARRPGAPTSAARRLASSWQARGDSAT